MVQQDMTGQTALQAITSHPDFDRHEKVIMHDSGGLQAIIAVHNTRLGPATGGCRIYPYASTGAALTDVLRLSRGMTYKSALAGLPLGGGKSVIIAEPARDKSKSLLYAMGDFIESLEGQYIAAEDSGTTVEDIELMAQRTRYVSGFCDNEKPGGDPSPVTAYGVFIGIQEAVKQRFAADLQGIRVAVQGVGNVGYPLVRLLQAAGAKVIVADRDSSKLALVVKECKVESCSSESILCAEVDVIAPCALGAAISTKNVAQIQAAIVAGAANNQLEFDSVGDALFERGILYAPDYVINSGGIIDIYYQQQDIWDADRLYSHVDIIRSNLAMIFKQSERQGRATNRIADELARARFQPTETKVAAA